MGHSYMLHTGENIHIPRYVIDTACIPLEEATEYFGWAVCTTFKYIFDSVINSNVSRFNPVHWSYFLSKIHGPFLTISRTSMGNFCTHVRCSAALLLGLIVIGHAAS
jgi:hypothetical protein